MAYSNIFVRTRKKRQQFSADVQRRPQNPNSKKKIASSIYDSTYA
jgi:hypothetical protein